MRVDVNPFYTRASDNVDSDEKFIQLFSPEILAIFKDYPIWHAVNVLRSSPGGGKTTLLKMFTPKILALIRSSRTHDDHAKELFNVLTELKAFNQRGDIEISAALISFTNQYSTLEYLNLTASQKIRIFCALLNTRIILSVLRSVCLVKSISYPEGLSKLSFTEIQNPDLPVYLRGFSNCYELYEWATNEEEQISDQIDNIESPRSEISRGVETFYALDLLAPNNLLLDSQPLNCKIVVMLDDVHNLSITQRGFLVKAIIDKRPLVNTWISERLKALTMDELLSEGSLQGRDTNIIILENFWSKKYQQFEKFARSVANRRVDIAFENKMDFAGFLNTKMSLKFDTVIKDAIHAVQSRVKSKYGNTAKYAAWISSVEKQDVDFYEKLVEWRALEILLFRDANKAQHQLFEDLEVEELDYQNGNDVKVAAQLFLHDEFKIPFYFGIATICRLASSNIEQFLNIAGALFDLVQTNSIKKIINPNNDLSLEPEKQEEVIKRIVNLRWKDLNTNVPLFEDIKKLMDAIGQFCYSETYVPNAWNSPGINGIAITMAQRNEIKDKILHDKNHPYYKLAKCLTICIAYNLIDFKLDYRCKGKDFMVLYLNRIYCAKYQLPLNNGKFKEKSLRELSTWISAGFNAQPKLKM